MGIPQFWYDVACGFKRFAANVGNQVPEFKPAADEMMFCLSRWHGKTHGMPCQVLRNFKNAFYFLKMRQLYSNFTWGI